MLFQAYTSGQLAEFIHLLKGKANKDPLGKREETSKSAHPWKVTHCDYDDDNDTNTDNEPEYNNNSNVGDNTRSDNDILFDFEDDGSDNSTINKDIDGHSCLNSGYNNNKTNITIIKDTDKYYTIELNEYK